LSYESLDVKTVDSVTVIRFRDQKLVEEAVIRAAEDDVNEVMETSDCENLLFNLSRVTLMASLALSMIFSVNKRMETTGGRVAFCGLNAITKDLFRIAGLDKAFDIYQDEATALKAMANT
jgi:anti-anti-sigma factor